MKPDYRGGGLVNLVASIVEAYGGRPRHAALKALSASALAEARTIVLLIIDGLGDNYLRRRGEGGELARRRRATMTSVFPSTTASAITTSYTGCTPLEHGLTGWFSYFAEAGCVAAPLPFRARGESASLKERGVDAEQVFPAEPLFATLRVPSVVVTDRKIVDTDYNVRHCAGAQRRGYASLDELVAEVEKAVKSDDGRKFVYAYWPDYDAVAHRQGVGSAAAFAEFEKIDDAFGRLLARLSGTGAMVIATADHGFIDVAPEESLELPASLAALLRFPLCGERRIAYCHVHDVPAFIARAEDWLGERAEVLASRTLVDEGWFGPGVAHPRFAERIGDVALLMRNRYTVKDWTPGEPRHLHIGNHGGPSEDEMLIPLIVENP